MAQAEGLKLAYDGEDNIRTELLETFDFDFAKMESDDFNTLPKEISSTKISFLQFFFSLYIYSNQLLG